MKKQSVSDIIIGKRYYRYNEAGDLEVVRILKMYGPNKFSIFNENDGPEVTRVVDNKELSEYRPLKADMMIAFSIVSVKANMKTFKRDVVATMFKMSDLTQPHTICRQFVVDNFEGEFKDAVFGATASVDLFDDEPQKMQMYTSCDSIETYTLINAYLDDSFKTLVKFVPQKFLLASNELLKAAAYKFPNNGISKSLVEMLKVNNFWTEVDRAFKIFDAPFEVKNNTFNEEEYMLVENHLAHVMTNVDIIKYAKDINLDKIKTDYLLLRDVTGVLYLVNFVMGQYLVDKDAMDEEELAKFMAVKK